MPIIIGIESTAHTFGVGVVKNGKVLSNVKRTYTTEAGGIIPMEAAKHHREVKEEVYDEALENANISEGEIDAIAFSQGPGLAPCLLEGMRFAKELSRRLNKPLVPVNHCVAHLEIGNIVWNATKHRLVYTLKGTSPQLRNEGADPVMLYVSGANTQIIAYSSGKYRIFGETLDIGVGNFIDNFGRYAGIGFPAGPRIEELAKQSKNYVELPYNVKGMDIALSGILTKLKNMIEKILPPHPARGLPAHSRSQIDKKLLNKKQLNKYGQLSISQQQTLDLSLINSKKSSEHSEANYTLADLAYSMQETVFAMLVETAERALAHTGKDELLLGGGVGCNKRLQEMCEIMCKERGAKFFCPPASLLVDNGAMIAYLGEMMFNKKNQRVLFESPRNTDTLKGTRRRFPIASDEIAKEFYLSKDLDKIDILPRQRTDEVDVYWK